MNCPWDLEDQPRAPEGPPNISLPFIPSWISQRGTAMACATGKQTSQIQQVSNSAYFHSMISCPHLPGWTNRHPSTMQRIDLVVALVTPQPGWIKQQKHVSSASGGWKSQVTALARRLPLSPPVLAFDSFFYGACLCCSLCTSVSKLLPMRTAAELGDKPITTSLILI